MPNFVAKYKLPQIFLGFFTKSQLARQTTDYCPPANNHWLPSQVRIGFKGYPLK